MTIPDCVFMFFSSVTVVECLLDLYPLSPHRQSSLFGRENLVFSSGSWSWAQCLHGFFRRPTLLLFIGPTDAALNILAATGLLLSAALMIFGAAPAWVLAVLWLLYSSIVNAGGVWYGFGWESQLLETGFLAIFASPLLSCSRFPSRAPMSFVVIWGYRWLLLRLMLGAGLIKVRGDPCWRDLTCMNFHYETQPVPGPLSRQFHLAPGWWHAVETLGNHFVELAAPWLLLGPRDLRIAGGVIQVAFQLILIMSGNLSFLNWLTILPALACFDDLSLQWIFGRRAREAASKAEAEWRSSPHSLRSRSRIATEALLAGLLLHLSRPVVLNLVSPRQAMNTSFDPFRIVNTYGAFGSITRVRTEIVLEGTFDDPAAGNATWQEFNFKCKPGDVRRRPCLITPYHYRLDWLMWFAAMSSYEQHPWILKLAARLMQGDEAAYALLAHGPFSPANPPAAIRALHYTYKFSARGSDEASRGQWYVRRRRRRDYFPPVTLEHPVIAQNFL
uniref:Lipase maturation factor 1 n=1 Tax=Tetraselmis sp. GSL018 TaxID=582737 RepID=A0A061SI24_9CHLO